MPDVAVDPALGGQLAWVGMERIATPVRIDAGGSTTLQVIASVDAFVNLVRTDRRGIHMSRLYRLIDEHLGAEPISTVMLERLLRAFLQSQHGLADRARLRLRFEQPVRRMALRSGQDGWRVYPVTIEATMEHGDMDVSLAIEVTYSSTCPASAALARQVITEHFARRFPSPDPVPRDAALAWLDSEQGIAATPHAQRSMAYVWTRLAHGSAWDAPALIDRVEASLGTPVQAMVKREDEQAFALANGSNLMFCEDAARRIQQALETDDGIADFHIRVEHQESLHAHNAVAQARKALTPRA
ncbi:GTP cyclohydrolase FolE2 [Dyella japonica]|uniref:GTP cyclohydrolase FolE2 n=1 Tax=Dyella japonica A8 TaxID=1217721 RepID=A0A075JZL1_9GAMM|nr:GTP cyclohydrolase FolE2 [Dyella japonica]AIF46947.1 GTP cyclohydrolase [Dyella japonica A8]